MVFACVDCGEDIVLPEDYAPPRPTRCVDCALIVVLNAALKGGA
jgi:hypothetical protein